MTVGPIDFIALEFPGNKFEGKIMPEIFNLIEAGVVRVFDLVIILKDQDGAVTVRELCELDDHNMAMLDPLAANVSQLITVEDINSIAEVLQPNTTAGLLLIENLWAKRTKQAMEEANGRLVMFERIPHYVVDEALAEIKQLVTA
jgi:uncharacterized membrane protein